MSKFTLRDRFFHSISGSDSYVNSNENSNVHKNDAIMVRPLSTSDKEACRRLLRHYHNGSSLAQFKFSDKKFEIHFSKAISPAAHFICLLAEHNDRIVGLMYITAGSYALSDEITLATSHIIAIERDVLGPVQRARTMIKLVRAAKKWSDTIGCHQLLIHVTAGTNLKATDRLLRKIGSNFTGGAYVL